MNGWCLLENCPHTEMCFEFFLLTLCNHLEVHYKKLLSPLELKLTLEAVAIATG